MDRRTAPLRTSRHLIDSLERRTYFSPLVFARSVAYPAGTYPDSIVAADLTGSGVQDVVTADYGSASVAVLRGNGNGTFQPPVSYPVGANPQSLADGDFDRGGSIDLVTANTTSNTVSVLTNNGDGTFRPAVSYPVGVRPEGVAVADFNGDGFPDIVTADEGSSGISVLINNGDGTFRPAATYFCGQQPDGIAVGDLNGDGFPDVVTVNPIDDNVHVLLNDGTGKFGRLGTYTTGAAARSVAIANINSDGRPDIVTADLHGGSISLLLGNGDGTFQTNQDFGVGAFPFSISTGDVNGDGRTDIVTANDYDRSVSVLLRTGTGTFLPRYYLPTGNGPEATAVADFNGDGKPDIAAADFDNDAVSVLLNMTVFKPLVPTAVTLTPVQTTVQSGNRLTLTAVVTTTGTAAGRPDGVVQFFDGDFVLGVARLSKTGVARISTRHLSLGDNTLTAHFGGDGVFGDSTSAVVGETVVSAAAATPFVVPSIASVDLPTPFVPGDRGSVRLDLFDQGAAAALGTAAISLSAVSTAGVAVPLVVASPIPVALAGGQTRSAVVGFTVPAGIAPGTYSITATVAAVSGLAAGQLSSVPVVAATTATAVLAFGNFGSHAGYKLVRTLANGATVSLSLSGPGTGSLTEDGGGQVGLTLAGTSAGSTLRITSTGSVNVAGIDSSGPVGSVLVSAGTVLSGTLNFTLSVHRIIADDVTGASLVLGGGVPAILSFGTLTGVNLYAAQPIRSLTVVGWTDTPADFLTAPWIGTLTSTGDLGPSMTLAGANHRTSLQSAVIRGSIGTGVWSIADDVASLTVGDVPAGFSGDIHGYLAKMTDTGDFDGSLAAGGIGAFKVNGNLTDAAVLSGANLGTDGRLGGGDDTYTAGRIGAVDVGGNVVGSVVAAGLKPDSAGLTGEGSSLVNGGAINAITVGGTVDSTSRFLATHLPVKAVVGGVPRAVAGDPEFLI